MSEPKLENRDLSLSASLITVFLCVCFGANAVAIKLTLTGLGVFTTAGLRLMISAAAIAIWAAATRRPFRLKPGQLHQILIASALFTFQTCLFFVGLDRSNASRGTLLANLQPFLILVLAHFFVPGDRMTLKKAVGILLGFAGVVFVVAEDQGLSDDFRSGDLLILSAVVFWACNTIYIKRIISEFRSFQIAFYPALLNAPLLLAAGLIWDRPMFGHVDSVVLCGLLYQGLVTAAFGFVVWNSLLKKHGAVTLHSFIFIIPIAGVVLGGVVLGETVATRNIVLALVLIVAGIITVHSKRPKRR